MATERSAAATGEQPSFVVIQTDDQTLDSLYASFAAYPGAPQTRAMPNTLNLIAKRGMTFKRYYVSYPLCCPSRVSLHDRPLRAQPRRQGQHAAERGLLRLHLPRGLTAQSRDLAEGAGYRTIHVGKFLNGYGDEPYDEGKIVPPGWDAWHTVLQADTHHLFYGYK